MLQVVEAVHTQDVVLHKTSEQTAQPGVVVLLSWHLISQLQYTNKYLANNKNACKKPLFQLQTSSKNL